LPAYNEPAVREAAVRRLTDEALLARIAKRDTESTVRARRWEGSPTDPLAQLAKSAATERPPGGSRKLTDQAVLARIARTESEPACARRWWRGSPTKRCSPRSP